MSKIIHYCWFGGSEKPPIVKKCIDSWKEYFPDFEIMEWNEQNFDIHNNRYVEEAYQSKKYAFVSDVARFYALEKFGGLYFDTDVEVIKDFAPLLDQEAFAGFETDEYINPGLVLWVKEKNNRLMKEMLNYYEGLSFIREDGSFNTTTICIYFTEILKQYGLIGNGKMQRCGNITIYPKEYFCPFNDQTGVLNKTENTYAIHWYSKTWMEPKQKIRNKITRALHRFFGTECFRRFRK